MKSYKVGICDSDLDYSFQLMDYINSKKDMGINITAFSGMNEIGDYLKVQDLDLIVTSDASLCEETSEGYKFQDVKVVLFTDCRDVGGGWQITNENLSYIFKFQRVDQICEEIRGLIVEKRNVREMFSLMAVYSPLGRCGKTRLAKALTNNDGVRGGLYVAIEDFCDNTERLDNRLLYLLKSNSPELEEALSSEICTDKGIHSLVLSSVYMDMHDVTFEDMERLKTCLLKLGRYTSIVFDIGSAVLNDLRILTLFDRIFVPVLNDDVSQRKIEVFNRLLKDMGLRGLTTKMIDIELPDVDSDSNEMQQVLWRLEQEIEE